MLPSPGRRLKDTALTMSFFSSGCTAQMARVISDETSALSDSFQDGLLDHPVYTRPAEYKGWKVPDVLLSGNEALIRDWEFQQSMERTKQLRPDLLK